MGSTEIIILGALGIGALLYVGNAFCRMGLCFPPNAMGAPMELPLAPSQSGDWRSRPIPGQFTFVRPYRSNTPKNRTLIARDEACRLYCGGTCVTKSCTFCECGNSQTSKHLTLTSQGGRTSVG